ncbi:hypothetical protein [Microbulbifer sp. SAOS-129_SWC]|uniref:hypothetical protein n=1 Tax=Microbulbifer sp. SAOS-129_SWC TaxID=3145235 RepID=UPI0032164E99
MKPDQPEQTPEPKKELPPKQAAQFASLEVGEDPDGVYIPERDDPQGGQLPAAPVPVEPQGHKLVATFIVVVFGLLEARRGPLWKLTPKEAEELARTGGDVLDYYFQLSPSPLGAFLLCAGLTIGPRVALDIQQTKKRQQADAQRDQERQQREGAIDGD